MTSPTIAPLVPAKQVARHRAELERARLLLAEAKAIVKKACDDVAESDDDNEYQDQDLFAAFGRIFETDVLIGAVLDPGDAQLADAAFALTTDLDDEFGEDGDLLEDGDADERQKYEEAKARYLRGLKALAALRRAQK